MEEAVQKMTLLNKTANIKDLTQAYETYVSALESSDGNKDSENTSCQKGPLNEQSHKMTELVKHHEGDSSSTTSTSRRGSEAKANLAASKSNSTSNSTSGKEMKGESSSLIEEIASDAFRIQGQTETETHASSRNGNIIAIQNSKNINNKEFNDHNTQNNNIQSSSTTASLKEKKNEGDTLPVCSTMSTNVTSTTAASQQVTTLHFKSGISLTIPSQTESSKKVIANAGKINVPSTSTKNLPVLPKLESYHSSATTSSNKVLKNVPSDEVDSLPHFGALKMKETSSGDPSEKKKNYSSLIAESKKAAARAMSLQNSNSSSTTTTTISTTSTAASKARENLFHNICLVFTSAMGLINNPNGTNKHHHQQQQQQQHNALPDSNTQTTVSKTYNDEHIELLTMDPMYLKKESSGDIKFLSDADYIIDYELNKVGKGHSGTYKNNETTKPKRFLNGATQIQNNAKSHANNSEHKEILCPEWFQHFYESEDTCIPASIVLLARIEQAIRESHQTSILRTLSNSDSRSDNENLNLVTPPSSPSRSVKGIKNTHETIDSSEDGSTSDNFFTPSDRVVDDKSSNGASEYDTDCTAIRHSSFKDHVPRFLSNSRREKATKFDEGGFASFLGSWKHLQNRNSRDDVVRNVKNLIRGKSPDQFHDYADNVLQSFSLKDLLLVPICSVLLIQPPASKLGVNQTLAYIRLLVTEWSQILSTGLAKVQKELAKRQLADLDDSLVADLDILLDDNAVAKPGAGKKKKRKKKKKVNQHTLESFVIPTFNSSLSCDIFSSNIFSSKSVKNPTPRIIWRVKMSTEVA